MDVPDPSKTFGASSRETGPFCREGLWWGEAVMKVMPISRTANDCRA